MTFVITKKSSGQAGTSVIRFQIDDIAFIAVDAPRVPDHKLARPAPVGKVDMTIQEQLRLVSFDQIIEDLEPGMGRIGPVIVAKSGRMGHQHIEPFAFAQLEPQLSNPLVHLLLGKLPLHPVVAVASSQAKKAHPFIRIDPVFDRKTA